ncbi:MAG: hypothetical protein R3E66_18625 [bacterium]
MPTRTTSPKSSFLTFEANDYSNSMGNSARLVALSTVNGSVVQKLALDQTADEPLGGMAAGNINGVAGNEIVVCNSNNRVQAYDAQGSPLWLSEQLGTCGALVISDIDQDGSVEVIAGQSILYGATGGVKATLTGAGPEFSVADVNGDGALEIVAPMNVYNADGNVIAAGGFKRPRWPLANSIPQDHPRSSR